MKEDIKLKKVEKTSNIKSFIVIEPGLSACQLPDGRWIDKPDGLRRN